MVVRVGWRGEERRGEEGCTVPLYMCSGISVVEVLSYADGSVDDDSNAITFPSPGRPPRAARTTWTLLIYLTSCEGGETVFYPEPTRTNRNPEPVAVAPVPGMALLHRHGDRCMLHEGKEVLQGEKWVLRSDLVVVR